MSNKQTQTKPRSALPTHTVYTVPERKDAPWCRIGAAWAHDDAKGFNLKLDALPMNGQIVLRESKANEQEGA